MNLPHIQQQNLGPKALRAITQPLVVRRGGRQTGEDLAVDFLFGQTAPVLTLRRRGGRYKCNAKTC